MNSKNLKEKTIKGFKWSLLDNAGRLGGQFVIGIILTRLLSPADFGLVGMLTIFIVLGQSLTNSGFGQALIQKKDADNVDFSTVFYFNIFASTLLYLLFALGSPLIAQFYNQPQLILLTKVICLTFLINAFGLVQITYLEKNLDFKAPSIIGVVSVSLAGIISIILAYKGFGVWALVANTVLKSIFTTILLWKVSKWKPKFIFSMKSLQSLFSYGSKILVAGIIQSIFKNIYYLIIGRLFPASSLGYYTRAHQFKTLPVNTITVVVQRVTYPVFSIIQHDHEKLTAGYTKTIRSLAAITIPLMVIIYITATPLIQMVLGNQWLPVAPYLQLMSLYAWINVIFTINNQVITVKGRSDYYLHIQVIEKILIVISILLTYKYGITAMIYGHMIATGLSYFIGSIYLNKLMNISLLYQIKNIMPFLISAIVMLAAGVTLSMTIKNNIPYLITSVFLSTGLYILMLWLFNVKELNTGLQIATKYIKRMRSK